MRQSVGVREVGGLLMVLGVAMLFGGAAARFQSGERPKGDDEAVFRFARPIARFGFQAGMCLAACGAALLLVGAIAGW